MSDVLAMAFTAFATIAVCVVGVLAVIWKLFSAMADSDGEGRK